MSRPKPTSRIIHAATPELTHTGTDARLSVRVEDSAGRLPEMLWLQFPARFSEGLDARSMDWVLVALLMPAMDTGATLQLAEPVSALLRARALGDLQSLLRVQNPSLQPVAIEAEAAPSPMPRGARGVGCGFSAGVDSMSTLALSQQGRLLPISHLVTLNVGAMGDDAEARALFEKYRARVESFAASEGYTALPIDSNLALFYQSDANEFSKTVTLRNLVPILAFQHLISVYYLSSTHPMEDIFIGRTERMSRADPMLLPMLSTEVQFQADSGTYLTRVEKTRLIQDIPYAQAHLDVCVAPPERRLAVGNCSHCWKCGRTLLTLELLGTLRQFAGVFDLATFKEKRPEIIRELAMRAMEGDGSIDLEVFALAQAHGKLPRWLNLRLLTGLGPRSWSFRHHVGKRIARLWPAP